jgi:DNA repair photolyase
VFRRFQHVSVGMSVPTDGDETRQLFEPHAPPISTRIAAAELRSGFGRRGVPVRMV